MPTPHHRKKHKQHVQQFKQSHDSTTSTKAKGKGSASGVFAFGGVAIGLLLGYLASNGSLVWAGTGLVVGGIAGYLIGRGIDGSKTSR